MFACQAHDFIKQYVSITYIDWMGKLGLFFLEIGGWRFKTESSLPYVLVEIKYGNFQGIQFDA